MKKTLLMAYRFGLVAFAVVILIIGTLSVMPLAQGDISVEPHQEGVNWRIKDEEGEEEKLIASGDIWMNNSGNFNLEDIRLKIQIEVLNDLYINETEDVEKIEVGESKLVNMTLSKDIADMSEDVKDQMVKNETDIDLAVNFEGQLKFGFLVFDITQSDTFVWEGVLLDGPNYDFDNAEFSDEYLTLPVSVTTSDQIDGEIGANSSIYWEDDFDKISSDYNIVEIGGSEVFELQFKIEDERKKEFLERDSDILFRSNISLEETGFNLTIDETTEYEPVLKEYEINEANATLVGNKSENNEEYFLSVPYEIKTNENDLFTGDAQIEINMSNEDDRIKSKDSIELNLGDDENGDLRFPLNISGDDDMENLLLNDQNLEFSPEMKWENGTIELDSSNTEWGAPLQDLEIGFDTYKTGDEKVTGNLSFNNTNQNDFDFNLSVRVYDNNTNLIGKETYPNETAHSNQTFEKNIVVQLDEIKDPHEAYVTIEHMNTRYEYKEKKEVKSQ